MRMNIYKSWAYGGSLFLPGDVEIRELGAYPGIAELRRIASGSDRVGLYRDRLAQVPELEEWFEANGYEPSGEFESGWSRPVAVFSRVSPPPAFLE